MSLVLLVGMPSLSACSPNSTSDGPAQESSTKNHDESVYQSAWLLSKSVVTLSLEDIEIQITSVYERDEHGNIIKLIETDDSGYTDTTTYAVDSNGIKTAKAIEGDNGETIETAYTCQIDSAGRPVRYEAIDGSEIDEYTYDADGNRTKAVLTRVIETYDEETGESGQETRVTTCVYDTDGFVTSERDIGAGDVMAVEITYERDESGRVTKATEVDWAEDAEGNVSEGSKSYTYVNYTYDDLGNLLHADYDSDTFDWSESYEWVKVEEASIAAVAEGHVKP